MSFYKGSVPLGSILVPLLFLVYKNEINNEFLCNIRLFADDPSLYVIVENPDTATSGQPTGLWISTLKN